MYGDDFEYANSRLAGTIVRLEDGEPVFVHEVLRGMHAEVSKLSDLYNPLKVNAKDLNLTPVTLGMCNFEARAHYLYRMPMRRDWKQGLRNGNFTCATVPVQLIPPDILRQVIIGEYPSLKKCLEVVVGGDARDMAWSRSWAVSKAGLLYKDEGIVGVIRGGTLILNDRYKHLQEALEEVA